MQRPATSVHLNGHAGAPRPMQQGLGPVQGTRPQGINKRLQGMSSGLPGMPGLGPGRPAAQATRGQFSGQARPFQGQQSGPQPPRHLGQPAGPQQSEMGMQAQHAELQAK